MFWPKSTTLSCSLLDGTAELACAKPQRVQIKFACIVCHVTRFECHAVECLHQLQWTLVYFKVVTLHNKPYIFKTEYRHNIFNVQCTSFCTPFQAILPWHKSTTVICSLPNVTAEKSLNNNEIESNLCWPFALLQCLKASLTIFYVNVIACQRELLPF